jgi:hypothetical protein
VEATLSHETVRREAAEYLKGIPNVVVKWVGFEPNLGKANHNCTHRDKPDPEGHVEQNIRFLKNYPYTFPAGVAETTIQLAKCEEGPDCPKCKLAKGKA